MCLVPRRVSATTGAFAPRCLPTFVAVPGSRWRCITSLTLTEVAYEQLLLLSALIITWYGHLKMSQLRVPVALLTLFLLILLARAKKKVAKYAGYDPEQV